MVSIALTFGPAKKKRGRVTLKLIQFTITLFPIAQVQARYIICRIWRDAEKVEERCIRWNGESERESGDREMNR